MISLQIQQNTLHKTHRQEYAIVADGKVVGLIELFNYDEVDMRAEVGIYIEESHRGKGYGRATIEELMKYCKEVLQMHQVVCDIAEDNTPSLRLFESQGFTPCGILKDWTATPNGWQNAVRLQKIL